jgi:hypothetical protein
MSETPAKVSKKRKMRSDDDGSEVTIIERIEATHVEMKDLVAAHHNLVSRTHDDITKKHIDIMDAIGKLTGGMDKMWKLLACINDNVNEIKSTNSAKFSEIETRLDSLKIGMDSLESGLSVTVCGKGAMEEVTKTGEEPRKEGYGGFWSSL